jgi:hypothetical protein
MDDQRDRIGPQAKVMALLVMRENVKEPQSTELTKRPLS